VLSGCSWPGLTSKIQSGNKRVESSLVACLDPGSIPGDSTKKPVNLMFTGFFYETSIKTGNSTKMKGVNDFF